MSSVMWESNTVSQFHYVRVNNNNINLCINLIENNSRTRRAKGETLLSSRTKSFFCAAIRTRSLNSGNVCATWPGRPRASSTRRTSTWPARSSWSPIGNVHMKCRTKPTRTAYLWSRHTGSSSVSSRPRSLTPPVTIRFHLCIRSQNDRGTSESTS